MRNVANMPVADALAVRHKELDRAMDELQVRIIAAVSVARPNWADVGTASHVLEKLEEINKFLRGE